MCMWETYTAVSPIDVEEGESEQSLVAFLGEELLFILDKISFKVDHFWCTAIRPAHERKQKGFNRIKKVQMNASLLPHYKNMAILNWVNIECIVSIHSSNFKHMNTFKLYNTYNHS